MDGVRVLTNAATKLAREGSRDLDSDNGRGLDKGMGTKQWFLNTFQKKQFPCPHSFVGFLSSSDFGAERETHRRS